MSGAESDASRPDFGQNQEILDSGVIRLTTFACTRETAFLYPSPRALCAPLPTRFALLRGANAGEGRKILFSCFSPSPFGTRSGRGEGKLRKVSH